MTNKTILAITLITILVLCALAIYSGAEGAPPQPSILYVHDDVHKVGCWLTEQGGIFCIADPAPSHNGGLVEISH